MKHLIDTIQAGLKAVLAKQPQSEALAKARYALSMLSDLSEPWKEELFDKTMALLSEQPQAEVVPPGFVLVPVEPDEMWAYRVIRYRQPNLDVGCKAWLECLKEMLHWHAAIAAQGEKP